MAEIDEEVFTSNIENLPIMLRFVQKQAETKGFSGKKIKQIELVAEEALVNIVHYAYPKGERGQIKICCSGESSLEIKIEDAGIPYNPVHEPLEDPVDIPLIDRKIGGLGRFYILKLMDEVSYKRVKGHNVLSLKKYL